MFLFFAVIVNDNLFLQRHHVNQAVISLGAVANIGEGRMLEISNGLQIRS